MSRSLKPNSPSTMQLGKTLKKILAEKGMTLVHLSKITKVPLQTLHNWVGGQNPRNLDQVKRVADELGVSLDYMISGSDSKIGVIKEYEAEINAGIFEVILRKVKGS